MILYPVVEGPRGENRCCCSCLPVFTSHPPPPRNKVFCGLETVHYSCFIQFRRRVTVPTAFSHVRGAVVPAGPLGGKHPLIDTLCWETVDTQMIHLFFWGSFYFLLMFFTDFGLFLKAFMSPDKSTNAQLRYVFSFHASRIDGLYCSMENFGSTTNCWD